MDVKMNTTSNIRQSAVDPYIKEALQAAKLWNKNLVWKSALSILPVSTNAFYSTNFSVAFLHYQAPANSVAQSFCIQITHSPQFLDSLRRRANARNVSFRISLRWPIHIMNPVDKTKLSCTFHRFFPRLLAAAISFIWHSRSVL